MRKLPRRGFPDRRVSLERVESDHMQRDDLAKAAYNAGLSDALWALGEYTKKGAPIAESALEQIRRLEKFVG